MSNICDSVLTITGPERDLAEFQQFASSGEEAFSLNRFVPMPPELLEVRSPNRDTDSVREMTMKHGFPSWYEWHRHHWGVKWDAADTSVERTGPETLVYRFHTPDAPPGEDVMKVIWARFPALHLTLRYEEPDMQISGEMQFGPSAGQAAGPAAK